MLISGRDLKGIGAILHPAGVKVSQGTIHITECGSEHNNCCALVLERGLTGRASAKLAPLIRKAVASACFSSLRPLLEKNLQAETEFAAARDGEFLYERDAPPHLEWVNEESKLAAKAGCGFGTIGLISFAEEFGFQVKMRIRTRDAPDNDGWWLYTPTVVAPEFTGFTLWAYHTGGWHWKLGTLVGTVRVPA